MFYNRIKDYIRKDPWFRIIDRLGPTDKEVIEIIYIILPLC